MPLNRLPDYISSNINLTGVSSDYLDGVDLTTISSSLRSNHAITGGGTITFDASANLSWTQRLIIISNGRGPFFSTAGYYDIDMPSAGTVITGVGGSANRTVSASGISINVWEALYYILPIGGIQTVVPSNFRIASYGLDLEIPHNWVLIAVRNGETGYLYLNNGIILELGKSQNGSIQSYLKVGTSNTENYIAFRGTTGDEPGIFTNTYVGERLYGGAEQSELVLFKGNDNDLTSGPDRIRSIAAHHVFDTYTSPLSGSFNTVAASVANVTRMIIREGGNVGIGTTSPHTIGESSTPAMLGIIPNATTTVGLVVRGIASQSANLQEWQNNTPTTVASISNTGAITAVDLTLSGNLTVNGTTTNINTTNLVVEDKNIILADVASPSTTTADGGGITLLAGGSNKTFNWINATDRWTSSVGLEGSSIVRTGGTSSQFLKADGTVDSSTYLTTGTASSTYAPINNPTFTGNVTAPLFRVGAAPFYQYETQVGGGTDLGFKKLATITLPTGLYTGLSFYIEVIEVGGNFGNTAASTRSVYFVSAIRSGGVQDDAMSMTLTGPSTNRYLQGVKVDSATYEIQVKSPSNYNHLIVRGYGISGLNSSVVWSNATVAGSTGIATYTPTSGSNEWFGNIKFWGTLSKDGGTSAQFLKADGTVDSSTYLTTGTASSTYAPIASPTFTGSVTLAADPTSNLQAATKQYVDGVVASLNFHEPVKYSTTAALGTTGNLVGGTITTTYANGTSGVGATLTIATSTNWTAITIDGQSLAVNDRVIIKDQAAGLQNGIYTVTSVGAIGNTTSFVFTRATDSDNSPANELKGGDFVFVLNGTANAGYGYVCSNTSAVTIGTTAITYAVFNTGIPVSAGNGLSESIPGTLSINTAITADLSTAQTFTNKTLTSPTLTSPSIGVATGTSFNSITGLSSTTPTALGTAAVGTGTTTARADHVHSNTADQFITSNNGNGTNFRVGDDVWLGDINVADTMSVRGIQSAASGFIRFGSDTNPLGYNGTTFSYGGTFNAAAVTTSGALALNYASPAITSNNASAASIFTSTVTSVTIGSSAIKTTEYPAAPSGTTSGTVTQSAQLNGYVGMPQNPQATSGTFAYTFAASDAGKHIYATGTPTSVTFTIPANSAVAFEIGTTFVVMNDLGAATNISIAITTDTMQLAGTGTTGTRTLARYGVASITKVTATKWIISGNGLT